MTPPRDRDLDAEIVRRLRRSKRRHNLVDKLVSAVGEPREAIEASLDRLVERGAVVRTRKGRVALAERVGLVAGRVQVGRRGRAVVIPEDGGEAILLRRTGLRPAMHGDRVLVEVQPYRRGRLRSGTVVKVLERKTTTLVGSIEDAGEHYGPIFVPAGPHGGYVATLERDGLDVEVGQTVEGRILEYPTARRGPVVRVERVLGPSGTLPTEIAATCRHLGIPMESDAAAERGEGRSEFTSPEV